MTHSWRSQGVTGSQSHGLQEKAPRGRRQKDRQTDCQMATEATEQAANTLDCRKSAGREQCVQKLLMNDVSSLIIMRTHLFAHTPSKCIHSHQITLENDGKDLKIINLQELGTSSGLLFLLSPSVSLFSSLTQVQCVTPGQNKQHCQKCLNGNHPVFVFSFTSLCVFVFAEACLTEV